MTTKKPTIAARPLAKSAEDFLKGAAQNLPAGDAPAKRDKAKKTQIPLLILPSLLEELDEFLERQGTGISRSAWICQAIKKSLDGQ